MSGTDRGLAFATIEELGSAIRSGAVSPTELAEYSLERLDTVGRSLNAVATLTPERAMAAARRAEDELSAGVDRGPLHGIPYGAKDLLATVDYPTSWGAAPLRDQQFGRDAEVIRRLDEAGAVLVGKLSMVVRLPAAKGRTHLDAAFNVSRGIFAPWGLIRGGGTSFQRSGTAVWASGWCPLAIRNGNLGGRFHARLRSIVVSTGFRSERAMGMVSREWVRDWRWNCVDECVDRVIGGHVHLRRLIVETVAWWGMVVVPDATIWRWRNALQTMAELRILDRFDPGCQC